METLLWNFARLNFLRLKLFPYLEVPYAAVDAVADVVVAAAAVHYC